MLPPLDDERKQKICEMYKSGAPLKEIREVTGCYASVVGKVVKEAGLEPRRTYTKKNKSRERVPQMPQAYFCCRSKILSMVRFGRENGTSDCGRGTGTGFRYNLRYECAGRIQGSGLQRSAECYQTSEGG